MCASGCDCDRECGWYMGSAGLTGGGEGAADVMAHLGSWRHQALVTATALLLLVVLPLLVVAIAPLLAVVLVVPILL